MKHFARGELYLAYGLAFAAVFYPTKLLARWLAVQGWDTHLVLLLRIILVLGMCEGLAGALERLLRRIRWIHRAPRDRSASRRDDYDA